MIYTIGHGNRPIGEFIALLRDSGIECLVDVRAYPASRRHPQFARDALEKSVSEAGIRYVWEGKALGGRRRPAKVSPHTALTNEGFRAYADHMMTGEFGVALERLVELGRSARTAILCAERLPWQCHRSLMADALVAICGAVVLHLGVGAQRQPHRPNAAARVVDGFLVYDVEDPRQLPLPE